MEVPYVELTEINKSVQDLHDGFVALKKALPDQIGGAVSAEAKRLTDEVFNKLEAVQAEQDKLKAVLERPGFGGADKGAEDEKTKAERQAFNVFARKGERAMTPEERKSLTTDVDPAGGFLIPQVIAGTINGHIFETSPIRQVANVITTSNKSLTWLLDDQEAAASWAGEGDSPYTPNSESAAPNLGQIEITARKLEAYPQISLELLQDAAFNVDGWLAGKVADKFGRTENTAFVNGNGVKQPRGFMTYQNYTSPGVYQRSAIEQIANGSTSAVKETGLIALQNSLLENYQPNATWLMQRATFGGILQLNGSTFFRFLNLQPAMAGDSRPVLQLLGAPVRWAADMPTVSSGTLPIAYGDFKSGYTIMDRLGISVMADPYTRPGFMKYYTTKRTGGDVTNFEAIKLMVMA
jgi:HK97 family phage major capsid protein